MQEQPQPKRKRVAPSLARIEKAVISALEDVKARDIEVFDVKHLPSIFEKVIIASADSTRQTKALANHVRVRARELGIPITGIEGEDSGEWVLVDLGGLVVHVMQPAVRAHFNLEEIWNQPRPRAPRKSVAKTAASAGAPPTKQR